jgi:hypothetical protein
LRLQHYRSLCRGNIDAGIRNKGDEDFHTYDGRLLEAIQEAAARVNKSNPYPGWKPVPATFVPKEVFGAERLPEVDPLDQPIKADKLDELPELDEVSTCGLDPA